MSRPIRRNSVRDAVLATLIVVGTACGLAPVAAVAGTIDQQQADAGGGGSAISSTASLAQTFTAGLSGALDQVDLHLGKAGAPTAPLSVEIRAVSGGVPGNTAGSVLASQSVPESSVAPLAAFTSISFATPASVVAGTQYAIVAYSATTGGALYTWTANMNTNPNPYAGGGPFFFAGSPPPPGVWGPDSSTLDDAFKTYVVVPPTAPTTDPTAAPTGQRAAALKKCKKQKSKKARKKCKKRALKLPV